MLPLLLIVCGGCFGYQVGRSGLYRADVQTIHVPVFRSRSFRNEVGELLTEAVVKEIESRTSYKVVPSETADSVLVGEILSMRKRVVAENAFDDPRDLELQVVVEFDWFDRQGRRLITPSAVPLNLGPTTISASPNFIPEGGQSVATAELEAMQQVAREIVGQMELPW